MKPIKKYSYKNAVKAFDDLNKYWQERASRVQITTANKEFDNLWNNWWCYQLSMRYWFGNTAHPQTDYGSDFAGWRASQLRLAEQERASIPRPRKQLIFPLPSIPHLPLVRHSRIPFSNHMKNISAQVA